MLFNSFKHFIKHAGYLAFKIVFFRKKGTSGIEIKARIV